MGSGEFGGGGSVRWQVRYDDHEDVPDPGGPHQNRGKGKDKGSGTTIDVNKMYALIKNGRVVQNGPNEVIVEVTLANDKDQIVVKWGDDVLTVTPRGV